MSKSKFRQASHHCKKIIEAAKLAYANKTWEFNTFHKFGYCNFWQVLNSVLSKCKSTISPLFNGPEVLSSVSDMEEIFLKIFSENFNLDDPGVSFSTYSTRSYLKLHNIPVSSNIVKEGITDLDSSKA